MYIIKPVLKQIHLYFTMNHDLVFEGIWKQTCAELKQQTHQLCLVHNNSWKGNDNFPSAQRENHNRFFPAQRLSIAVKGNKEQPAQLHSSLNISLIGQFGSNKAEFSPFAGPWAEIRN